LATSIRGQLREVSFSLTLCVWVRIRKGPLLRSHNFWSSSLWCRARGSLARTHTQVNLGQGACINLFCSLQSRYALSGEGAQLVKRDAHTQTGTKTRSCYTARRCKIYHSVYVGWQLRAIEAVIIIAMELL
jgi:hypothetical protein